MNIKKLLEELEEFKPWSNVDAKLGKEKYNKKFNTPQFTDEDLQKVAKELEDYYTTD